MHLRLRQTIVLTVLMGIFSTAGSFAAVPDQYQQLFDHGDYSQLLVELNKALAKPVAKADAKADSTDRYALLSLKGEALLRTKAGSAAEDAFRAAAALAGPDENSIAIARGTAVLIKRSGLGRYQPKSKPTDTKAPMPPIDIIDPTSRKHAFAALFTDMSEGLKPVIATEEKSGSLPAISETATQFGDLRAVEIAATGSDSQSKSMLEKIATRATAILEEALKPMDGQITAVEKQATSREKKMGARRGSGNLSASLYPEAASELDDIVQSARTVSATAAKMLSIFGNVGDFKTVESDAEKVVTDANKVLTKFKHPAA